jgi:hypothetical protein
MKTICWLNRILLKKWNFFASKYLQHKRKIIHENIVLQVKPDLQGFNPAIFF